MAGVVGGGLDGAILQAIVPALAGGGGLDIGSIIGQIAGGGVGGAVLMIIVSLIRNAMAKTYRGLFVNGRGAGGSCPRARPPRSFHSTRPPTARRTRLGADVPGHEVT
jgi:hypothetical protein